MLSEKKVTDYELTARARDGKETVVSYNAATIYDRDRTLQGVFAAARDVTERKRVEVELQQATAMAQTASQTKSDFLASMSHEIRTPLNAIIGMADLLKETTLTSDQRVYANVFQEAGNSLLLLINDILDLSKMEADQLVLEETDFDLGEILENAMSLMNLRAYEKSLSLVYHIAPGVPICLAGDIMRLRQIILNLLGNAIKFTERGEVTVLVDLEPGAEEPGMLRFSVADTGIGIPLDKLEAIFEGFTQVDSSTSPQVRRDRPRPDHLPAAGRADGRTDLGGERRGQGIHVLLHGTAQGAPGEVPAGPGTPPDARRAGAQHRACETKERPGSLRPRRR